MKKQIIGRLYRTMERDMRTGKRIGYISVYNEGAYERLVKKNARIAYIKVKKDSDLIKIMDAFSESMKELGDNIDGQSVHLELIDGGKYYYLTYWTLMSHGTINKRFDKVLSLGFKEMELN